jgi:hypothetical protein
MDINQLFTRVVYSPLKPPKSYLISLDESNLPELFEFLLEFFTMLCKHFHGDLQEQVNLQLLSPTDFERINKYMLSIGFNCTVEQLPANYNNTQYFSENRYDRITITDQTTLSNLFFALKFNHVLFVIHFDIV